MGLYGAQSVDIASMAVGMRDSVYQWFNARIQIIDPQIADADFNEWDNQNLSGEPILKWEGPARIQQIRTPLDAKEIFGETTIAAVRFQIPLDAMEGEVIRKGLRVVVIDPGEDKSLVNLQYIVRRALNSSFAWNRTIECETDMGSTDGS